MSMGGRRPKSGRSTLKTFSANGRHHVGHDRLPRYCYLHRRSWTWRPTMAMRAAGFKRIKLGPGIMIDGVPTMGPMEIARAVELNQARDRHPHGLTPALPRSRYLPGSIGDGYARAMALREQERQANGIAWAKEHHSRDDWPRAWKRNWPLLGDCEPKTVTPETLLKLRTGIDRDVSPTEAHRVIKVWRALWKKMAVLGLCEKNRDPSLLFVNSAPKPRQDVWFEGEAARRVNEAWRSRLQGHGGGAGLRVGQPAVARGRAQAASAIPSARLTASRPDARPSTCTPGQAVPIFS